MISRLVSEANKRSSHGVWHSLSEHAYYGLVLGVFHLWILEQLRSFHLSNISHLEDLMVGAHRNPAFIETYAGLFDGYCEGFLVIHPS